MYSGLTLEAAVAVLEERYAAGRQRKPGDVRPWFAPLRALAATAAPDPLSAYVEGDRQPGSSAGAVLSRWRQQVFEAVKSRFGCQDLETVLFAWDIGLLPAVGERRRRYSGGGSHE
jgi:hypothetical protein